jgi:putative phosphoesterase
LEEIMEFAILSDTHLNTGGALPDEVRRQLSCADGILHAGDLTSAAFLADLRSLAPVTAVRGNCDGWDPGLAALPRTAIALCGHLRVGLTHGAWGVGSTTPDRAAAAFAGKKVDIIVFGHSHAPFNEIAGSVHLFNPGSLTQRRRQPRCSYGWLTVADGTYRLEHIYL